MLNFAELITRKKHELKRLECRILLYQVTEVAQNLDVKKLLPSIQKDIINLEIDICKLEHGEIPGSKEHFFENKIVSMSEEDIFRQGFKKSFVYYRGQKHGDPKTHWR